MFTKVSTRSINLFRSHPHSHRHFTTIPWIRNDSPVLKDKDPFPISLQHPSSTPTTEFVSLPELESELHPEGREDDESPEILRARLLYQTRKRGILETDLLLSTFSTKERLDTWDLDKLREFDRFLTIPDWTIYYLSIGKQHPLPDSKLSKSWILQELREHAKNTQKEVRRMPDL